MSVTNALSPLTDALALDGYELVATELGGLSARIEVVATGAACPDCLIPREMFTAMVLDRLRGDAPGAWSVEVVYPAGAA